jgi:5,5'-dehydrodivanillate O-demethylase
MSVSPEANRAMSEVGPGSLLGSLLRWYWQPIGGTAEIERGAVVPRRLLGEDLVLYRDRAGHLGLLQRSCPHRGTDLSCGWVEERGVRCCYHGWLFDETGTCKAQPYEDAADSLGRFRDRVRAIAYPVREHRGLVWAWMGSGEPPPIPNWELFTWGNGFVQVVTSSVPCNWLQAQENSIDPVHFEWLHETWTRRLAGDEGYVARRHVRLMFEEHHFGFVYGREREEDPTKSLQVTHNTGDRPRGGQGRGVFLWPNALYAIAHIEWRVPIDDENTLSVGWFFDPVPRDRRPFVQGSIPTWTAPVFDATGRPITSHIMNQDFAAWIGQGRLAARDVEHLGRSDRGVLLARRRLLEEAEVVKRGGSPKSVLPPNMDMSASKSRGVTASVELPVDGREYLREGPSRARYEVELARTRSLYGSAFPFLAGQPNEVAAAYAEAMGISSADLCARVGVGESRALP